MEDMDFDSILQDVDDFGNYQRLLLAFVLLPAYVPNGFHAYNQIFMAATPDHYCRVPHLEAMNFTTERIKNLSIPLEERDGRLVFSECFMYDLAELDSGSGDDESVGRSGWDGVGGVETLMNASDILIKIYDGVSHPNTSTRTTPSSSAIVPCKHGWVYDRSIYSSTIVTEWDVVCDKGFLPTLALVLLGFGGLVGNYIFGYLQDSLGRRPSFFIYLAIQCVFGIATGFALDFWSWLLIRIAVGFTVPAIMGTPFILAMEMVGSSKRTLSNVWLNISYSMCLMALAGVAYLVRGWRNLAFATTLPFLLFVFYWWVLPESPRWLFAHGKLEETERILRQMAQVNGRTLPPDYRKVLQAKYEAAKERDEEVLLSSLAPESKSRNNRNFSILDLFRGRVLRRNTIIITFIWFINMGVYVGLSYYAPILGGDEYLNFFLAGLAEMPTYFFLLPSLENLGRRWTLFGSMILGGTACLCTILVENDTWTKLSLYCIGKFGISAGFVAIQEIAAEIYPTVVRGLGISFSTVIGMIGPTLVPLVNYTGQDYMYLPLLTLGALMVVGGMAALGLPETLGRSLPQTLVDAEKFSVDCSWRDCCCPKGKRGHKEKESCSSGNSTSGTLHSDEKQRKRKPMLLKVTTTATNTTTPTNKDIKRKSIADTSTTTKANVHPHTKLLTPTPMTTKSSNIVLAPAGNTQNSHTTVPTTFSPQTATPCTSGTTKEVQVHFVRCYAKSNAPEDHSVTLCTKECVPQEDPEQQPLLNSTSVNIPPASPSPPPATT